MGNNAFTNSNAEVLVLADVKIIRKGRYLREQYGRGEVQIIDEAATPVRLGFLWVAEGAQGKGIGKALIMDALDRFGFITGGSKAWGFTHAPAANQAWLNDWYDRLGVEWVSGKKPGPDEWGMWTLKT